jgi:hypothetical protein
VGRTAVVERSVGRLVKLLQGNLEEIEKLVPKEMTSEAIKNLLNFKLPLKTVQKHKRSELPAS